MDMNTTDRMLAFVLGHPQDDQWMTKTRRRFTPSSKWAAVFRRADALGLGPVLYRQLRGVADDLNIPTDAFEELKNAYLQNVAQNTYRRIELKRILTTFTDAGLCSILLKGDVLAETVYHDPGARVYNDLDILVHKKDLQRARDLLYHLGYRAEGTAEIQENYRKNHHHLAPMIHQKKMVTVELHWNVDHRTHVDVEAWWRRSTPANICGGQTRILGWTDMALHLCLHQFSGGDTRTALRGMVDIYRLLVHSGESIDWALFDDEARRYGIQDQMYAVLRTVKNIWGPAGSRIPLPALPQTDPSLVVLMEKMVFQKEQRHSMPGSIVAIRSEKRWKQKTALLWRRFFPNRAEMSSRYQVSGSSWKVYLCYLFRPFQLVWRYKMFTRHLFPEK